MALGSSAAIPLLESVKRRFLARQHGWWAQEPFRRLKGLPARACSLDRGVRYSVSRYESLKTK